MPITDTKEQRFESDMESYFLSPEGGYVHGEAAYDPDLGLYPASLLGFVKRTQEREWAKFAARNPVNPEHKFCLAFDKACENFGMLHVLRKGFSYRGMSFKVCYFRPETGLNQASAEQYAANEAACYRQWYYSKDSSKSVDMVLVLNGIPLFALELKNQLTGQSVDDARRQWMRDRSPQEPCFLFNRRVLGFFCVDLYEAYMTTRLARRETVFLPFNQGSSGAGLDGGKGNPPCEGDYVTSYVWRNVFRKDSMMDILQKFMNLEHGETAGGDALIFPRYHQLDAVRKIVAHVREHGAGHHYLIQHSAGSGKSNTIAWTAYRLASLHDAGDRPVFSSVVVVTDRNVLDRQLQETLDGFDHMEGSLVTIGDNKSSKDLRDALNARKRIIVTTLQKFPVIYDQVEQQHQNYAVIVDEAHSSQTGTSAHKLKTALADRGKALERYAEQEGISPEELDGEDVLLQQMATHGRHENLSFFAFTATPKDKTLELFGEEQEDNSFRPFHIYSMRQAIEEGFILDVLGNYMTYKCCFRIANSQAGGREYPSSEAAKMIRRYANLHPHNIAEKSRIIVETFRSTTMGKIGGRGKMMVVTASRLAAVKYFMEVNRYIAERQYQGVKAMVAFSGAVNVDGEEVTEAGLNGIPESQTKAVFHENGQILIVAEKYQTGFDEKLLHTMIVDKRLRTIKAVQTLSRLNRTAPGKVDTFVLDFVNTAEDMQEAFQPYYQETMLSQELDIDQIYTLREELRRYAIYSSNDIEAFILEYTREGRQDDRALGRMTSVLKPVVDRYNEREENERYLIRRDVRSLVRWYGYASQVTSMFDRELHKEYTFCSYLQKLLQVAGPDKVDLDGILKLEYYKLSRTFQGAVSLIKEPGVIDPPDGKGGAPGSNKKEVLEAIIARINERYNGEFTPGDRVLIQDLHDRLKANATLERAAKDNANPKVFAEGVFPKEFEAAAMQSYRDSHSTYTSLFANAAKYEAIRGILADFLYHEFRSSSLSSNGYTHGEEGVKAVAELEKG